MVAMLKMKIHSNTPVLLHSSVIYDIQGETIRKVLDNQSVYCGLKEQLKYTLQFQKECQLVK